MKNIWRLKILAVILLPNKFNSEIIVEFVEPDTQRQWKRKQLAVTYSALMQLNRKPIIMLRKLKENEYHLLKEFTYQAIFQRDENNLLPKTVLDDPKLKVYYEDFGKPDDECLAIEADNKIVGAVWTRILSGEVKGFGNIDEHTPEFGISLFKEYRNKGLGTILMKSMLELLKKKGYKRTSLSVQKDNYAVNLYKNVGFSVVKEMGEEYLMVCDLR